MNDAFLEGRGGLSHCCQLSAIHVGEAELSVEWMMSRVGAAVSSFRHGENCPLCLRAIERRGHRP